MSKTINTLKIILEYVWLAVAAISIFIGVRENIIHDFKSALPFYLFAFIALFFFSSRRKNRISTANKEET